MQFYPGLGRVAVEGHPVPGSLAPDEALADFVERSARTFDLGHFLGFNRLDSTATIAFEDPRQGMALLRALAAVRLPYIKPAVYGNPPETVYLMDLRGRGRKLARAYDKGIESGTAERGRLIRLEDQRRFKSGERPGLQHVVGRELFERRFAPVLEVAGTLEVCDHSTALDALAARLVAGSITDQKFDALAAFVHREARALPSQQRTARRKRQQLREIGIALTEQEPDSAPVDLAAVVGATITSKEWR
jgi:hypothetical protein